MVGGPEEQEVPEAERSDSPSLLLSFIGFIGFYFSCLREEGEK